MSHSGFGKWRRHPRLTTLEAGRFWSQIHPGHRLLILASSRGIRRRRLRKLRTTRTKLGLPLLTNSYGIDYVGYGPSKVLYYRLRNRTPCSANVDQAMSIHSDSSEVSYKPYGLSATIGNTAVGSAKDGIGEQITHGASRGAIRAVINLLLDPN